MKNYIALLFIFLFVGCSAQIAELGVDEANPGDENQLSDNNGNNSNNNNSGAGTPPTLNLTSTDVTIFLGNSVSLGASANDTEDGSISANIDWSGDIDGSIATGASYTYYPGSEGTHTITAQIEDSNGNTDSETFVITVINPSEIIVDNAAGDTTVETEGVWGSASGASSAYGGASVYADIGGATDRFRFRPNITYAGNYDVYAWNSCYTPRSNAVPHLINHAGGQDTVNVDQDSATGTCGAWEKLGTYSFNAGTDGYVQISDEGLSLGSYVGADAVRFAPACNGANCAPSMTLGFKEYTIESGDTISLSAFAIDDKDGDISANITWTDSVAGNLGTGAVVSYTPTPPGIRTVTAQITDSDGAVVKKELTVNIISGAVSIFDEEFDSGSSLSESWWTHNASALPGVTQSAGRYRAEVSDNTGDVTLHFNNDYGRFDGICIEGDFEIIAYNVGIGLTSDSQAPVAETSSRYTFAGVQVRHPDFSVLTYEFLVVGHRGTTYSTLEGKSTTTGSSSVTDAGLDETQLPGSVDNTRMDIRVIRVGEVITWYYRLPSAEINSPVDPWTLFNTNGRTPTPNPTMGNYVWVGLISYAQGSNGVPFVGTADRFRLVTGKFGPIVTSGTSGCKPSGY